MIPKLNRINRENFEKMMKKGGLASSGLFSIRFLENPEKSTSAGWRISMVVAKKVAKTAVSRNKIRRRAYSILRKYEKSLPPAGGFMALFGKKGVEKATFSEVESDIENLLKKAKML